MFSNQTTTRFGFKPQFRQRGTQIAVASPSLIDSYSEANADAISGTTADRLYSGNLTGLGESFTGVNKKLTSSKFFLGRGANAVTGNIVAKLYWGIDEGDGWYPDGAALVTSDAYDSAGLTTTRQLIEFTFSGAQQYQMEVGVPYVMVVEYTGGDATHYVVVGIDATAPSHSGQNLSYYSSGVWAADTTISTCFYVYGV